MTPPPASALTHAQDVRFHLRNAENAAFRAEAEARTAESHDQARRLREGIGQLKKRAAELEESEKGR